VSINVVHRFLNRAGRGESCGNLAPIFEAHSQTNIDNDIRLFAIRLSGFRVLGIVLTFASVIYYTYKLYRNYIVQPAFRRHDLFMLYRLENGRPGKVAFSSPP
jgi:hypothetical protein